MRQKASDKQPQMVAGIKEIAMQIAVLQESFGIQDEDTEFHTMFQKGGGAKRTREEQEDNNSVVADHSGEWEQIHWPIPMVTEEETKKLQVLWKKQK